MRSTGEFPSAENVSTLSQILQARCAGKILFESEGVSGYTPQGFRPWQGAAGTFAEGAGASGCVCLNDQGGSRMDVTEDVAATLRAENHGHPPCVMGAAGFCTEHSAQARGIGYEEETSPTLRTGTVPAAVYENHSQDTRYTGPLETAPTVMSTYGTGGNDQPFVVETPKTLKIRSGCEGGGKGALIQDNKSATLGCNNDQTVFVPFVKGTRPHSPDEEPQWKASDVANTLNTCDVGETRCNELAVKAYGICSKDSNAMKSENPKSGFYEAETSRCLDANGGNPTCNQGGMAVSGPAGFHDWQGGIRWSPGKRCERGCVFHTGRCRPTCGSLLHDHRYLHPGIGGAVPDLDGKGL